MKRNEILEDDYEILAITSNFPPTSEEIKRATRKKGRRFQYWIKVADVPINSTDWWQVTFINKKNK